VIEHLITEGLETMLQIAHDARPPSPERLPPS
jgi:flagellar biosynthesis protein FliR